MYETHLASLTNIEEGTPSGEKLPLYHNFFPVIFLADSDTNCFCAILGGQVGILGDWVEYECYFILVPLCYNIPRSKKCNCEILSLSKWDKVTLKRQSIYLPQLPDVLQGLPLGFDIMFLALVDRNMQVRFGLKVIWES